MYRSVDVDRKAHVVQFSDVQRMIAYAFRRLVDPVNHVAAVAIESRGRYFYASCPETRSSLQHVVALGLQVGVALLCGIQSVKVGIGRHAQCHVPRGEEFPMLVGPEAGVDARV